MKKQVKVVMLPTEDISGEWIQLDKTKDEATPHHIYIISDDEIKEGDWCYFPEQVQDNLKVVQIEKFAKDATFVIYGKGRYYEYVNRGRKIIATSDILLIKDNSYTDHISNVSQDFLKAFVESDGKENWEVDCSYYCCNKLISCNCKDKKFYYKLDSNYCVILSAVENICTQTGKPCGFPCIDEKVCTGEEKMYSREDIVDIFTNPSLFRDAWSREDVEEQLDRLD